ncbi:MAG: chemotaxis protein CheW [Deltaproteobacteria bacterium]|nr:chemotaxis protein CheW [Deltaproteobacteria bacterium]MCL5792858.1 chemotaxis protein CheW [Deltaproteobacteria bacterium]
MNTKNSDTQKLDKNVNQKELIKQFIVLKIGNVYSAIDINKIVEIIKYTPFTKVPKAPDFLEGVIDVRGTIIPIVDMRKRFDVLSDKPDENARIVIVRVLDRVAGLILDEVKEVLKVPESKVMPPPQIAKGIGSEYLSGVVSDKKRIIMVLELDKILSTTEKIQFEKLIFKDKKQKTGGTR